VVSTVEYLLWNLLSPSCTHHPVLTILYSPSCTHYPLQWNLLSLLNTIVGIGLTEAMITTGELGQLELLYVLVALLCKVLLIELLYVLVALLCKVLLIELLYVLVALLCKVLLIELLYVLVALLQRHLQSEMPLALALSFTPSECYDISTSTILHSFRVL
jgi:hypothetical protein